MKGRLVGSFFCQKGDGPQSSAARVVPSVAYHLAVSNKTIRASIEATIAGNPLILTDKAIGVQLNELIRRPLENAGAPLTQVPSLIILDGLDECGDSATVQRLLFAIRDDVQRVVRLPLLFLITSRPEFPIESFFRTIPQLHRQLHLGVSEEADNDIRKYLLHGFSQIRTKHSDVFSKSTGTWPLDDDINSLVYKASGHFIYASTVLKFVDHSDDHPKNSLRFILSGHASLRSDRRSPYADMDELYLAILRRVVVQNHENLLRLLAIISSGLSCPCRAADMLDIALEEVQITLRGLRSVVQSPNPLLEFLHGSFEGFLMDPLRSAEFFIGGDDFKISGERAIVSSLYAFPEVFQIP